MVTKKPRAMPAQQGDSIDEISRVEDGRSRHPEQTETNVESAGVEGKFTAQSDRPEEQLGQRLQQARESAGFSLEALSRMTKLMDPEHRGISRPVLGGYEKGTFKPGAREVRVLYKTLDLTPNWLILGEREPKNTRQMRAAFKSDEEFYSELIAAVKKLDENTQDGLASLVFHASTTYQEAKPALAGFMEKVAEMADVVADIAREKKQRKRPKSSSAKPDKK